MVPRSERRVRGLSLTQRLTLALAAGAVFVAVVFGFLGAERRYRLRAQDQAAAERGMATALAERAAPLLERADLARLAVLTTVARDHAQGRVLVLDRSGLVVIDTALVLSDRHLGLAATNGPVQHVETREDGQPQRETLVPIRFGGEPIGELRLQCNVEPALAVFDLEWFGLALLGCLTLVAVAAILGHHWATRLRTATGALIRLSAGEVGGDVPVPPEAELQELVLALRELERGQTEGLQRVGEGCLALALQVVAGLEKQRLVPPGHGERTARLAAELAERVQLLAADRADLDTACRLVDLGKAWVRAAILQKQGPLTELEAHSLEQHPMRAADQLDAVPGLRRAAKVLRHHLERYDGFGGPDGLRGDRIPLGSRILAIVSAFDALVSASEGADWNDALRRMARARGDVFDPWLFDLFCEQVHNDPPPSRSDPEVMIVPGGTLPWRTTAAAAERDADGEHDAEDDASVGELEVMLDDPKPDDG